MELTPIVDEQEWHEARDALLVKEKEFTRARDALAARRRRMPRMLIEKDYEFDGPNGKVSLLDMFEGRRQLIIYRFFYEPGVSGWPEKGCPGCSMMTDQRANPAHINARDTTVVHASRAPQENIQQLQKRMGWEHIPWYTITDDWDSDFGVDEWHATNVFLRVEDRVYRTYMIDGRGDEALGSTFSFLDIAPLGRQEEFEDSPEGYPQGNSAWWRRNDEYESNPPPLPLDDETLIAADERARSAAGMSA